MILSKIDTVLDWVWNDLFRPRVRQFGINFILDVLVIGSQVGAYTLLFKYVNAIENSAFINIGPWSWDPRSDVTVLWIVAICTGVLFLLFGILNYQSRLYSLKVARQYEAFCSKRILKALQACPNPLALIKSKGNGFNLRTLKKALIKDTRFCGKLVGLVSKIILTQLKLIASLIVMCYINFFLSGVLIVVGIPLIILLRKYGKKVVRLTKNRESQLPEFISYKKNRMNEILKGAKYKDEAWEDFYEKGKVDAFYGVYYAIFKKIAVNELVIFSFIALLSVVVVLMAGNLVLFGNMSWTVFVAYMLALRFFFGSLQGMSTTIKKASRSYDYVNHYQKILGLLTAPLSADAAQIAKDMAKQQDASGNLALDLDLEDDDDDDDDDDF